MKVGLVYLNENKGACPPLGLMSIATYVTQNMSSCQVEIIDVNFEDAYAKLESTEYDLIGLSAMTIDYNRAIDLACRIKHIMKVPIVIGGVHISTLPESLKECFDIGVIGEGEQIFLELLQLYERVGSLDHEHLTNIDGLVYIHGGRIFRTEERKLIEPLDLIPVPDTSFISTRYFAFKPLIPWGEFGREAIILTSRGCPYKCVFCSTTQFWKKIRFFSPEHVVEEVKGLIDKFNIDHIQIFDDLFTINKKRLKTIAEAFKKYDITKRVKFACQLRANLVDDELCGILEGMNVAIASFGFESGSDKVLKYLKAGSVSVEQNKNAIKICRKHGLKVVGSLIFGSPGETVEDMEKTIEFIDFSKKAGADRIWSFVMTPFPGTQVWEVAKNRGKVNEDMDFGMLSHQAVDNPLCLDESIGKEVFKKIFYKGRAHMNYYKWKKLWSMLKKHPMRTANMILHEPLEYLKKVFTKYKE